MTLTILDIILLITLSGFVFYGLFFGLIRTLGSIIGILAGAFLASHFYLPVSEWANSLFFGFDNLGKVVVFFLLFTLVNRLISFGFYLLNKAFDLISIIPFLKTINRLTGAILGFVEGGLVLGLSIYVAIRYIQIDWFVNIVSTSKIVPFLLKFVKVLLPLLSKALKSLEAFI
jgi:uncharacterized membrane protein required for colicin V production